MKRLLFLIITVIIIGGCYSNQMVVMKESKAFLKIDGDKTDISIKLDNKAIELSDKFFKENILLEIKPGIYNLKIYRNRDLIIERKIILDPGKSTEISL